MLDTVDVEWHKDELPIDLWRLAVKVEEVMHVERDSYALMLQQIAILPEIRKQHECVHVDASQLFSDVVFVEPIFYLLTETTSHLIIKVL